MRPGTWNLERGTAAVFLLIAVTIYAAAPQWWTTRGVTVTAPNTVTNDFAPATQGQLKWIATQAAAELAEKLPGGAGPGVAATVAAFTTNANYAPVAIGQAKAVVAPIYDRLIAVGYTTNYPWTSSTNPPNDFAPLNLGQLKYLFSFDIGTDTDRDGMPDWWEDLHGLDANDASDANLDADGDGVPSLVEFQIGTEPRTTDDVRQAGVVLWPETRSVASGRTLAKEGTLGFTPDVNVVYQRMTVSGRDAWDYSIHGYDEDDNEALIGQESGSRNGYATAAFLGTTNCTSLWTVNGYMNQASSYTISRSNDVRTWSTNISVTWNGTVGWNDVPHGENTGWQVRSCNGDQTAVECFTTSGSNAPPPGECQTNQAAVSPVPLIPLQHLQVYDDSHAEGYLDPTTRIATVLLDRPWRLTNIMAAVRAEVAQRVDAVWAEDGWGDPPVKWIHNCPSVLSCGDPVAGYEVNQVDNTAVAVAGQYRIVVPNSTPGVTYRVASIQLMVSPDISVLTQVTAYARGTGYAVTSTPVLVECPTNEMCVFAAPLGVAGRDAMLCWSQGGGKDLHEFTTTTMVGIGNENLLWTATRIAGAADYVLDSNSGVLTYGSSGGVYRVTVAMHDYPRIFDTFTIIVLKVDLDVDHNRDRTIKFTPDDATASVDMYRFWINNDRDYGDDDHAEDLDPITGALDHSDTAIQCQRDLEDFSPLGLRIEAPSGVIDDIHNGFVKVSLAFKNASGAPAIKLYRAVNTIGEYDYLDDTTTAAAQAGTAPYRNAMGEVTLGSPFAFPVSSAEDLIRDLSARYPTLYLIFEGSGIGSAELVLRLEKSGATICESSPVFLDLKDVKKMYEHYTVGDTVTMDAETIPTTATEINGVSSTSARPEEGDYILFVHGWRMLPWERRYFAETAYKRLFWANYRGRFGFFSWPTEHCDPPWSEPGNYDRSEQKAWQSGAGLRNLLVTLNERYPDRVRVMAHSMGNIVASEALRHEAVSDSPDQIVHTYIASQAASVAHAYDATGPMKVETDASTDTPEAYAVYPPTGNPYYSGISSVAAEIIVNFCNDGDAALSAWEINQDLKPDMYYDYEYAGLEYSHKHWTYDPVGSGFFILYFPADRYQIYSFIAEARSLALGADAGTGGEIGGTVELSAAPYYYGDGNHEHSAQFRSTVIKRSTYWKTLLDECGIVTP